MAITLRPGEEIKQEVHFHWSAFLLAKVWAVLGTVAIIGMIGAHFSQSENDRQSLTGKLMINLVLVYGPILYRWLQNKCKTYLVTNQRLYVEEGILSKSKRDIPLDKINDLSMKQGLIQRLFGSGNLIVLTGNDRPTIIRDIAESEQFKMKISEMLEKKTA